MELNFLYIAIVGFLFLSAFFSSSETAFFSLTKLQLKKFEKGKSPSSKRITRLLRNPRELLIIILLGNTIVNVAASSAAALIAIELSNKFLGDFRQSLILFFEIVIMTILLLLFGEITPKLFAFSSPEKIAKFSSFFLVITKYIVWPVIKILYFISSLFSKQQIIPHKVNITSEDLKNLFDSKSSQIKLEESEKKIFTSIFRFQSTTAREILTPRVDLVAVEASEGLKKLKKIVMASGHSKIPVFKKNIDNIIGVVYAKDIILHPEKGSISSLLRPSLIVPENMKIQNLLNQFKRRKIQIAIVVDEYGGTSGLITLEDILEELVGEILDEYDKEQPMISKISEDEYLINGMYSISELNQEFHLNINEEKYDYLAEFLYDNFNKVPQKNESFVFKNLVKFTITNIISQRINYTKMKLLQKISKIEK